MIALALTLAAMAGGPAQPSVPATRLCHAPSRLVLRHGAVRVMRTPRGTYLACTGSRRPVLMVPYDTDAADRFHLGKVAVSGTVVAWVERMGGPGANPQVTVCDIATGRGTSTGLQTVTAKTVAGLVAAPGGAAWLVQATDPADDYVMVADGAGARIVAQGPMIARGSLSAAPGGASWTVAGQPQTATFTPGVGPPNRLCRGLANGDHL